MGWIFLTDVLWRWDLIFSPPGACVRHSLSYSSVCTAVDESSSFKILRHENTRFAEKLDWPWRKGFSLTSGSILKRPSRNATYAYAYLGQSRRFDPMAQNTHKGDKSVCESKVNDSWFVFRRCMERLADSSQLFSRRVCSQVDFMLLTSGKGEGIGQGKTLSKKIDGYNENKSGRTLSLKIRFWLSGEKGRG